MYLGYEEADLEQEEFRLDIIPCPFCDLEMDTMELCFHVDDEHPVEAKNGVSYFICLIYEMIIKLLVVKHVIYFSSSFESHWTNED
jgi:Drought induced 19 protein (Di19), zinc-binding